MKKLILLLAFISSFAYGIDKKTPSGNTVKDKPGQSQSSNVGNKKVVGTVNPVYINAATNTQMASIILNKGTYMVYFSAVLIVSGTITAWSGRSEPFIDIGFNTVNTGIGEILVRHTFVASNANDVIYTPEVVKYVEVASDNTQYYFMGFILGNNTGTWTIYNNGGCYAIRLTPW